MTPQTTLCVSHGEDADGLICASFIRRLKNAALILVTYDELEEALRGVRDVEEVYICDVNLRESLVEDIRRIAGYAKVTYVDHHPVEESILDRIASYGVEVIHDPRDCASVLLYNHLRENLSREAGRLAAYAAWADQFEDGPIASELLKEYDRQFVQTEGLTLAYALTRDHTPKFAAKVAEELSRLAFPHRIEGVPETAKAHLEDMALLIESIPNLCKKLKVLAYCEPPGESPIGTVAGLIVDALGVNVGLCYVKKAGGLVNVSMRSRRGLTYHLGNITRRTASKHSGFGGGHKRASGASIPMSSLEGFIKDIDDELSEEMG